MKETNEDNGTCLMIIIILTLFLINGTSNVMRWEEDVAVATSVVADHHSGLLLTFSLFLPLVLDLNHPGVK